MESASTQVVVGGIILLLLIVGAPLALIIFLLLPDESYNYKLQNRIQVLVLGDVGRSPRMQYHALSIAKRGVTVDLIGYTDSDIHPEIATNDRISVIPIDRTPSILDTTSKILFTLFGPLKVLWQVSSLWQILAYRTKPARYLLVQNPPSIPVLLIASCICWLRNTRLVIDWHNFGYTILALKLGESHPLTRLSHLYEYCLSGAAAANFVVSDAMGRQLKLQFGVKQPIHTVHDRPMGSFRLLNPGERYQFLSTWDISKDYAKKIATGSTRLLVTSTSWTADEDFSILLDALTSYSELATRESQQLPSLLVVITGKGPQKAMYLSRISALEKEGKLRRVDIRTAWLSIENYASLLGAADLGVSLHTSSSGVDLPMKVVDMFGAGLPVVGWGMFEAWPELVKEGVNGRGFGSADELKTLLVQLFSSSSSPSPSPSPSPSSATTKPSPSASVNDNNPAFDPSYKPQKDQDGQHLSSSSSSSPPSPQYNAQLARLRQGALKEHDHGWESEWSATAAPVFGLGLDPGLSSKLSSGLEKGK